MCPGCSWHENINSSLEFVSWVGNRSEEDAQKRSWKEESIQAEIEKQRWIKDFKQ